MNVVPSVSVMKELEEYKRVVDMFGEAGVKQIRYNVSTLPAESYIDCINTVRDIYYETAGKKFDVMLDIPCPKDKSRIEFDSESRELEVSKDEEIRIANIKESKTCEHVVNFYVDADLKGYKKAIFLLSEMEFCELKLISVTKTIYSAKA